MNEASPSLEKNDSWKHVSIQTRNIEIKNCQQIQKSSSIHHPRSLKNALCYNSGSRLFQNISRLQVSTRFLVLNIFLVLSSPLAAPPRLVGLQWIDKLFSLTLIQLLWIIFTNLTRAKASIPQAFCTKSLLCLATSSYIAWTGNFQSCVVGSFNKILDEKKMLDLPASFNQQWSRTTSEDAGIIVLNLMSSALLTEESWEKMYIKNRWVQAQNKTATQLNEGK